MTGEFGTLLCALEATGLAQQLREEADTEKGGAKVSLLFPSSVALPPALCSPPPGRLGCLDASRVSLEGGASASSPSSPRQTRPLTASQGDKNTPAPCTLSLSATTDSAFARITNYPEMPLRRARYFPCRLLATLFVRIPRNCPLQTTPCAFLAAP